MLRNIFEAVLVLRGELWALKVYLMIEKLSDSQWLYTIA